MDILKKGAVVDLHLYWGEPRTDDFLPHVGLRFLRGDQRELTLQGVDVEAGMSFVMGTFIHGAKSHTYTYKFQPGLETEGLVHCLKGVTAGMFRSMFGDGTATLADVGKPLHVRMKVRASAKRKLLAAHMAWVHERSISYPEVQPKPVERRLKLVDLKAMA